MKKCSKCGTETRDDAVFCQNCGARLDGSNKVSKKGPIQRFKVKTTKFIKIVLVVFVLLMLLSLIGHLFFGIPLEPYTEEEDSHHMSQFNTVDENGDGAISYYEISSIMPDIPNYKLLDIFEAADKNDNGLLIGREFDNCIFKIQKYYKDLEKQKKAEQTPSQEKTETQSVSKSTTEYIDACPECGCDVIIEYPVGDGNTLYYCSACDYSSYDYDDFIIEVES